MTTVSVNLYNALKKAGVPEDLAKEASREVAEAKDCVREQDNKIDVLRSDIKLLQGSIKILTTLNVAVLTGFILTLIGVVVKEIILK